MTVSRRGLFGLFAGALLLAGCSEPIAGLKIIQSCGYGYVWVDPAGNRYLAIRSEYARANPISPQANLAEICK